jgi:hypothetical protein
MICREYRIFRLLPGGHDCFRTQEEIDFEEWASNLNNRHPIA